MNLKNTEDIVSFMRKIKNPSNSSFLIQKAIAYQYDVIPLVLKSICKSGHYVFIENAAILITNADNKYTEELYDVFPDIRNTYARSELCIVFDLWKSIKLAIDQAENLNELLQVLFASLAIDVYR